MNERRFHRIDLLLPVAGMVAALGWFYPAMAILAVYAGLYYVTITRPRRRRPAPFKPLTAADIRRIYGIPDDAVVPWYSDYE